MRSNEESDFQRISNERTHEKTHESTQVKGHMSFQSILIDIDL